HGRDRHRRSRIVGSRTPIVDHAYVMGGRRYVAADMAEPLAAMQGSKTRPNVARKTERRALEPLKVSLSVQLFVQLKYRAWVAQQCRTPAPEAQRMETHRYEHALGVMERMPPCVAADRIDEDTRRRIYRPLGYPTILKHVFIIKVS